MKIKLPAILDPGTRETADSRIVALGHLRTYFGSRIPGLENGYTGGWFDQLSFDRKTPADEFTAADLLAPALLSVPVPGRAVREILHLNPGKYNGLLARVGPDRDFFTDTSAREGLEAGVELEAELRKIKGVGPVMASKLIARKRPHLYPIYDSVVSGNLGLKHELLWPLFESVSGDSGLKAHLEDLRTAVGLDSDVSPLRIFDVLVWMDARNSTR